MGYADFTNYRYGISVHDDIDDSERYFGTDSIQEAIEIAELEEGYIFINDNWMTNTLIVWDSNWQENDPRLDYYIKDNEIHWTKYGRDVVVNQGGNFIEYECAEQLMDADLREELYTTYNSTSKQMFFDLYSAEHCRRFGKVWNPAKECR